MRTDAFVTLTATAEYWDYSVAQDDISGSLQSTYFKDSDIKLTITENSGQPLAFTREPLKFNGQLRNVRDSLGNPIIDPRDEGRFYFLGTPIPQFDVFGHVVGYKYTVTAKAGPNA